MSHPLKINITIPTFNREKMIANAIESALSQSYNNFTVTVIDDGSSDQTWSVIQQYKNESNFAAIKLGRNLGTAQAKNVSLVFSDFDAITFHDSDDIAHTNKVLFQARVMDRVSIHSDEILDWKSFDHPNGQDLPVDVVVGAYNLIKMDGKSYLINKRISLVDDFFPNLQFPSKTEGDWCLINAGLFRKRIFKDLGGFLDSIEEDRELRNRTIAAGCIYYFVEEPLLTKIEMSDSLTIQDDTNFTGKLRLIDREEVWRRNKAYSSGLKGKMVGKKMKTPIHLPDLVIEDCVGESLLTINEDFPLSSHTEKVVSFYENKLFPKRKTSEAMYG